MKLTWYTVFRTTLMVFALTGWLLPNTAEAKVVGQCALCHTMHNSQDGATVNASGPQPALISIGSGCVGCHTGTNTSNIGTPTQPTPYVTDTSAPTYNATGTEGDTTTLAGGSFYWVTNTADSMGHNVVGIKAADGAIGLDPPGWSNSALFQANDAGIKVNNGGATWANQLTCAGTYGCHGTRGTTGVVDDFGGVSGAHHADDSTIDGSTVAKSFRFLIGIVGLEDKAAGVNKWEFHPTATNHNQYKGVDKADDSTVADSSTISYFCAECHGLFHSGAGDDGADNPDTVGAPWIRHPTDYDMGNVKTKADYAGYNGGGATPAYSAVAPVGSADVTAVKATVYAAADDAIVTCISCHRAHGTPYADLLRWDYSGMVAGNGAGNEGCFVCHSTKD